MLAKKYKLTRKDHIQDISRKGKESKSRYFVVKYEDNNEEISRFALTISAKLSKKAVTRNKLRRQLYEIIRLNLEEITTGKNIVILLRFAALDLNYEDLEKNLLKQLKNIK